MMDFSLHLLTIFTFIRQNKATAKTDTHTITHIYKTCTGHPLVCTWLWICVAGRCTGNSPCTLYIYTYIQGREVVKCCKICLQPYHVVMVTLEWNTGPQPSHFLPFLWSSSASQQLSVWLSLGCNSGWENLMWGCSRPSALLCLSALVGHSMLLEEDLDGIHRTLAVTLLLRTELVSILTCHQKGIPQDRCDLTRWLLPSDKWKLLTSAGRETEATA